MASLSLSRDVVLRIAFVAFDRSVFPPVLLYWKFPVLVILFSSHLFNLIYGVVNRINHCVCAGCCKDGKHKQKSDSGNLEENVKTGILKKAKNASSRLRNSFRNRSKRTSDCGVCKIEEIHGIEEQEVVDAFRQALLMDTLLPARFDDYHVMLR